VVNRVTVQLALTRRHRWRQIDQWPRKPHDIRDRLRSAAVVMASMLYSLVRVVLDAIATSHSNEAKLRVEVLALRRQVQVLERQIKRVRWEPGDRMILAALRERLPRSAWAALLVQPETVLGWHRELVRRRWAAYRGRPRTGRPPLAEAVRELIIRMARENPRWGYFRIRGELLKLDHTVSATTVRSVLRRSHVPPAGRRSQMSWRQFLTAHAESLVATEVSTFGSWFTTEIASSPEALTASLRPTAPE
jgi:putative transposase